MSVTTRLISAAFAIGLAVPAMAQDAPSSETVVATVNGTEITLGHMIALRARLPQQYQQLPSEVLFSGILDQLVQQQLLADTEEALSPGGQVTIENETRAILANQAISTVSAAAITDEAVEAAYEETFASVEPETEFNASHILVETEEEALALIEELEGGADFATLAAEKSTGPSGPNGGSLGWFGTGAMVAPFEEAVLELKVEAISGPVQTQFGWHVIRLNETRLAEAPPLDAVRAELVEQLQRDAIDARIAELTESGEVDREVGDGLNPEVLNDPALLPE